MKSIIKFLFKLVSTLIILALLLYFAYDYIIPKLEQKDLKTRNAYLVTKVVDGDTFEVIIDGKTEKIRMLGIDSPEKFESRKLNNDTSRTHKDKQTIIMLGYLASEYTERLIGNKKVILISDSIGDKTDKYGRLLRYVYLEDGTFINLKIVQDGYAEAYRKYNYSKKDEFIKAEKTAREEKRGLWGDINGLENLNEF